MADIKITKKQFDKAYNSHTPNSWIMFAFKYFSKDTEKKNMALSNVLIFSLLGLFLLGFLGTIFNASRVFIEIATIGYAIILTVLVSFLLAAIFMNHRRLKKVAKILGISKGEYNILATKFYG